MSATVDVPTSDYDPFTPEAILDAHTYDGALRDIAPAVYLERYDVWAVARFADVQAMLKDWETFTSTNRPFFDPKAIRPNILLTEDPPEHNRTRSVIMRSLSAPALRKMQEEFDRAAVALVDRLLERGRRRGRAPRHRLRVRPAGLPRHPRAVQGGPPPPAALRRRRVQRVRPRERDPAPRHGAGGGRDRVGGPLREARRRRPRGPRRRDVQGGGRGRDHRARGGAARPHALRRRVGHDDLRDRQHGPRVRGEPGAVGRAARGPQARAQRLRGGPALRLPVALRRPGDERRHGHRRRHAPRRRADHGHVPRRRPRPAPLGEPGHVRHPPQGRRPHQPRLRHPRLRGPGARADRGPGGAQRARGPREAHRARRRAGARGELPGARARAHPRAAHPRRDPRARRAGRAARCRPPRRGRRRRGRGRRSPARSCPRSRRARRRATAGSR